MARSQIMPFAGLWESWTSPEGELVESFTIVTTTPNELMEPLHDRMPVILPQAAWDAWLDPANQDAAALLVPYPSIEMDAVRVSTRVNSVKIDDEGCVAPCQPR
jgi:putative SOS response-associated peptidase YedK